MRWNLLRRRLSVSAPRMTVRSHLPWPLRWALAAVVLGFCGALALWAAHRDLAEDPSPSPCAGEGSPAASAACDEPQQAAAVTTDGRTLFYAPAFAALPLREQAGWVAHAVLHVALRHLPRRQALRARVGQVDAQLWNLCADAVVQSALAHLRWLERPSGVADLPTLLVSLGLTRG
jgi:hypothetical protein